MPNPAEIRAQFPNCPHPTCQGARIRLPSCSSCIECDWAARALRPELFADASAASESEARA